ncbi:hypothetical protein Syun_014773 [Stephania yunnanensis]|uniref:Uncharacterized protein n=1 Tax=Stephania yunnanensis TaxID=152371 RepID=A0AAP0P8U5_9MAGN
METCQVEKQRQINTGEHRNYNVAAKLAAINHHVVAVELVEQRRAEGVPVEPHRHRYHHVDIKSYSRVVTLS